MLGEAPGRGRLEHVVLEHEPLGVGPVVGDLPGVVIAHHIDAFLGLVGTPLCSQGLQFGFPVEHPWPRSASSTNPSIAPPSMSPAAAAAEWGPP